MKKDVKKLLKLVPTDGGYDLGFNLGNGLTKDTVASTLNLTIFKKAENGSQQIHRRLSVVGVGPDASTAQAKALNLAVLLLGE